ncbi:unnamed protein product [Oppiella nova]|uniref:ZP domain-containing protein n=1 Tax=Oppiella nova TaxID=334625 RepID=A0A7R9LM84_9ACAR|nr:unnamed protein product [Oppiella nova]CAG2164396.1 unnamed protein product [Oppiella nova]
MDDRNGQIFRTKDTHKSLDVICGKEHMTVRAEFSAPFQGIISSKGTYGQDNCVYIKPFSSITHATFNVKYDQCGTKPDLQGKYYENTIVIQYGTDIIEAWDEAKRLRCEWFEAYEKPATFRPAIPVADLDVIEMNFQGDEIDCWMSIQEGKGPWAREVSRIVAVGQPMTIVIAINDFKNQFDMRVKSCFAHDGVKPAIHLTDEYGCVLRPKMLSPFKKIRDSKGKATLISYAQFLAFKFPDSMDVQIQCTVEVCRHGCADACQVGGPHQSNNPSMQVSADIHHAIPEQKAPEHDTHPSFKPEDEPQPVFQDIGASNAAPMSLMTMSSDVNAYNMKNNEQMHSSEETTHESHDDYPALPSNQNFDIQAFGDHMSQHESENKPTFQVPDLHIRDKDLNFNQKFKLPNLSDLKIGNLKPEDLNIANKLLSSHGLNKGNLDLSNLAATFAQGLQHKDIMSLIQTNNMKDLVSKFTNRVEEQPIAEALQSVNEKHLSRETNQSIATTEQSLTNPYNTEPTPPTQSTTNLFYNNGLPEPEPPLNAPIVPHPYNRFPFNIYNQFNKKIAINLEKPLPHSAPVAQILDIPLQPGMPFLQIPANELHKHQIISAQKPLAHNPHQIHPNILKQALHHPSHPFPPLIPNNQIIMNLMDKRKDSIINPRNKGNGGPQSQFPFGPRSLRLRRSVDPMANEIGVKKGFQVVTSVDLAFFPNFTTDSAPIYSGRRDNIVYGVCLPAAHLATDLLKLSITQ